MTPKDRPVVLKLGGSSALAAVADVAAYAQASRRPVCIVHGGGPQISALMRARGIEPSFHGGRRVTDADAMACVLQGLREVSGQLCAALSVTGLQPEPFLYGVLGARRLLSLGLVGEPVDARPHALQAAWAAGRVPVVAPLAAGVGPDAVLNVNADDAAACVAVALDAEELVFLSDVPGVLDEGGCVIPAIAASAPPACASGGMLPKLEACAAAVRAGVGRVRIGLDGTVVTA